MTHVLFAGPMPPPVTGQSVATTALASQLRLRSVSLEILPLSAEISGDEWSRLARKLSSHLGALRFILASDGAFYLSINSGHGMWLSAVLALLARLRGRRVFLHHHSYDHVRRRRARMTALAMAAGPEAVHIVLGKSMGEELSARTPGVHRVFSLNNAGLVDLELIEIIRESDRSRFTLGHLSNLSREKGLGDVITLALAARRAGLDLSLIVAGPVVDDSSQLEIARAREHLGESFRYLGPIYGAEKRAFFSQIDVFALPSRSEAEPLVLLEAMAAAVPCIATDVGCIADDLSSDGGIAIPLGSGFCDAATQFLIKLHDDPVLASARARHRFKSLLQEHREQISRLAELLKG